MRNLYIDGKDAYAQFGVTVTSRDYKDLVFFPPLKPIKSNDWHEEDGAEFDLESPALDTREVTVSFAYHGSEVSFGGFVELISDGAYHDFRFTEIGNTYRLRLASQQSLKSVRRLGAFSLRFADDFPLRGYDTYVAPQSSLALKCGYELDGMDMSEYGVCILRGSWDEVEKSPAVKKNLLQSAGTANGATYDGQFVTFQTKEVKLDCLMRANTPEEFWRNHNALLYDLTRPGEHLLYVDASGYEYPCCYKSCSVSKFSPSGKIWFEFSVALVFTSFRLEGDEYIIVTEDGERVETEQNSYSIDVKKYD